MTKAVTEHVVTALNPENHYYICFDQLDLGFSTSDERYSHRLTGLILASRDLYRAAREQGKQLSLVVFLRDDIYASLHFEDKNKITESYVSLVEWDRPGSDFTLRRLMERRFGEVYQGGGTLAWGEVFDERKEMPSRQTKYAHIADRTFLRPRDMIKFCNQVLVAHRSRGNGTEMFLNEDIADARPDYSEYLLNELDDEVAKHVGEYKEYLEVIKTIGTTQFSPERFQEVWETRPRLKGLDSQAALQDLFEFSVIGYLKSGGGGGGSKWVWRYKDPRARFNSAVERYRVHLGFKEVLDLTAGGE